MRELAILPLLFLCACASTGPRAAYDVVIRNGMLLDGSGSEAVRGDLAIDGDRITVGRVEGGGRREIDAHGLTIAPGFINIMSQAQEG